MAIVKPLDFLNDGTSDVLWRNQSNGALTLWEVSNTGVVTANSVTFAGNPVVPSPAWSINAISDFTGDGNSDLLWRNQNTGAMAEWLMNGSTITASVSPTLNALPATLSNAWQPQTNPTNFA